MLEDEQVKKFLSLSLAAVAAVGFVGPARADDDMKSCAKNMALLPVRAAAIATGMVVGIPVAIVRRTSDRCVENTNTYADKIGGHESIPPRVFSMALAVPVGMIVGTGEGVMAGGKNALQYGVEKPFSLSSLSLAEDLESSK